MRLDTEALIVSEGPVELTLTSELTIRKCATIPAELR